MNDVKCSSQPQIIPFFVDKVVESVAAGSHFSLVLTGNSEIYSFGTNINGELGRKYDLQHKNTTPQKIQFFSQRKVLQIYAGHEHAFAVSQSGKVYGWGKNNLLQIGKQAKSSQYEPVRINTNGLNVTSLVVGSHHQFAFTADNKIFTWGSNKYGELGLQHNNEVCGPTQFSFFGNSKIRLFAGNHCTYCINENNELLSWGLNDFGKLCLPHTKNVNSPQKVKHLSGRHIKQIVSTESATYVLVVI